MAADLVESTRQQETVEPTSVAGSPNQGRSGRMKLVVRLVANALALALAAWLLSGITVTASTTLNKVLTIVVVAAVFGVVNAVVKPVAKTVGCLLIALTLGLMLLVINALMLLLTSWICGKLGVGFHVDGFWTAVLGGLILSIVSSALYSLLGGNRDHRPVRHDR
jgi:putative membrane protein